MLFQNYTFLDWSQNCDNVAIFSIDGQCSVYFLSATKVSQSLDNATIFSLRNTTCGFSLFFCIATEVSQNLDNVTIFSIRNTTFYLCQYHHRTMTMSQTYNK